MVNKYKQFRRSKSFKTNESSINDKWSKLRSIRNDDQLVYEQKPDDLSLFGNFKQYNIIRKLNLKASHSPKNIISRDAPSDTIIPLTLTNYNHESRMEFPANTTPANFRHDDRVPLLTAMWNLFSDMTNLDQFMDDDYMNAKYARMKQMIQDELNRLNYTSLDQVLSLYASFGYQAFGASTAYQSGKVRAYSAASLLYYDYRTKPSITTPQGVFMKMSVFNEHVNVAWRMFIREKGNTLYNEREIDQYTRIRVTIDTMLPDYDSGNALSFPLYQRNKWVLKPIVTIVTTNDEHTRSTLRKADISIEMDNNLIYVPLENDKQPQAYRQYKYHVFTQNNVSHVMKIRFASGAEVALDLLRINYNLTDLIDVYKRYPNRRFNLDTGRWTDSGITDKKFFIPIVQFLFADVTRGNPIVYQFGTKGVVSQGTFKVWISNRLDDTTYEGTITVPFIVNPDGTTVSTTIYPIEITQPKPITVCYSTISIVTEGGINTGVFTFVFSKIDGVKYVLKSLVDETKFIDTVYVLGNKI